MKGVISIATTGIWKIDRRLDHVIDYIIDAEKTINYNFQKDLYNELHIDNNYIDIDYKTEKQYYVSSLNCSIENAYDEMQLTKKSYRKEGGILGFHSFQSFREGEVTPDLAHNIGVKLAEEMWGDSFEVVISTHINTNHIHNHFVVNSVSFKNGRKYYDNRTNYAKLRHLSDEICEEYGLSVLIEKPCKKSKINYSNYYSNYISNDNYYKTTKDDIDKAIRLAYSYQDFENLMKAMGYYINYRGKSTISVRREPYKKNIRLERNYGENYSMEKIKSRINEEYEKKLVNNSAEKVRGQSIIKRKKHKGLYGLYLYYCYLLKIYPQQNPRKKISANIRADISKFDKLNEQTKLLASNKIKTYDQFYSFTKKIDNELNNLIDKRSKLCYKYRKETNSEKKKSINSEIALLYEKIKHLRKQVKICTDIEENSRNIEFNVQEFEKQNEKEVNKNELIK